MEQYLTLWWVWVCVALAVGILELLAPGYIFLGFALGAFAMAGVVSVTTLGSTPATFALFAVLSLVGWIVLRVAFRRQSSGARIVTEDINEN